MLFPVSDHRRVAEERLARLLAENPVGSAHPAQDRTPARDPARMLVKLLLLVAVAGTWCTACVLN